MQSTIQILVLEDDQDLREMLAEVLEDEGYAVDTASHGEEAVAHAQQKSYDLVVADIRMDGIDGLEALSQVRSHHPEVGSLVVTGYADDAESERASRLGLGGCLKKPFAAEQFLEAVRDVLAQRERALSRTRKDQELRATAGWALEMLALATGLEEYAALADGVARQMHLTSLQGEGVRALVLALALERKESSTLPLPASLEELKGQVEQPWSEGGRGLALESRVASVVLAFGGQEWSPESTLSEQLESKWPGRFDPAVLKALDAHHEVAEPEEVQAAGGDRRGLLSLGRALERVGDATHAERAYEEILEKSMLSREGIEASLGLARLWAAKGQLEKARQAAIQVPELGRQLGGATAGHAALQAGLLLARMEATQPAQQILAEAEQLLQESREPAAAARALLARKSLLGETLDEASKPSLQLLFAPEYGAELAESAAWLLPLLLESEASGSEIPLTRATSRLVQQFPGELQRLLSLGHLSSGARGVAVSVATGCSEAEALLRTLAIDPDPEIREQATEALGKVSGVQQDMPLLRIYSFDRLEYFLGEERLEKRAWRTNKSQVVMARIAHGCGALVLEDTLLDLFWPGDPEKGRRNLYTCLSNIRRTLRSGGADAGGFVERSGSGIRLNPNLPRWHDYEEFQRSAGQAEELHKAGKSTDAARFFRRACQLYRGNYLEGNFSDWVVEVRHQTEQRALNCHLALARLGGEQRHYKESLEHAERALELDPCLQEAYLLSMNAQLGLGRTEQVARLYERCKKVLRRELEMEPSIEVERAYQRALMGLTQEKIG